MVRLKLFGIAMVRSIMALVAVSAFLQPAYAFCVRNDTGAPIFIEAVEKSAVFNQELANNKKACCSPKDEACAIGKAKV